MEVTLTCMRSFPFMWFPSYSDSYVSQHSNALTEYLRQSNQEGKIYLGSHFRDVSPQCLSSLIALPVVVQIIMTENVLA